MTTPRLIVSDPPHHVEDPSGVLSLFGLAAAEVRGKANYPIPEIWFAEADEDRSRLVHDQLQGSGFRVTLVPGQAVAAIPQPTAVATFDFGQDGLVLRFGTEELTVRYDAPVIGVFCQPLMQPAGLSRSGSPVLRSRLSHRVDVTEGDRRSTIHPDTEAAPETFFDLYVLSDGPPRRMTFLQDTVDFSGFGTPSRRAADNLLHLIAECQSRFAHATIDRRCAAMRLRRNPMVTGEPVSPELQGRRKGFSFGTTALKRVLDLIAPDLGSLTQAELSSRLVYLTYRAGAALGADA